MIRRRDFLSGTAGLAGLSMMPRLAHGQAAYPNQDIRFVCAFPPGSGADVLVRYFSNHVGKISGHTIIVENKAGAQGLIAAEYVARSKPDGYTVFVHGGSGVASIPALYKNPPIDVSKTIDVVATINRQPFMLVVDTKSPYQNVAQLTEAMKKKGDKASYGVSAPNGVVMGELYKAATGVQAVQVDYKTANDSLNDQLSGRLDYCMHDPVYSLAQAREGRLRILAVSTHERLAASPDLPTMSEQGVKMDLVGWWAAMVPAGTPQAAKDKLREWFVQSVADPETKKFLNSFGGDQLQETPEQAQKRLIADIDNWKEYVRVARIQPQS